MKNTLFTAVVISSGVAVAAVPKITPGSVTFSQDSATCAAAIGYVLADAPAIVTVDVQTNRTGRGTSVEADWVSVGAEKLTNVVGEVNKLVQPGAHVLTWNPTATLPALKTGRDAARAVVKAWPEFDPPDYLCVSLADANTRNYYVSSDAIPGGIHALKYKTSHVLLRRMHARLADWRMGLETTDPLNGVNRIAHDVTLTSDYYIGVFQLTCGQFRNFAPFNWNSGSIKYDLPNAVGAFYYGTIAERYGNDKADNLPELYDPYPMCTAYNRMRGNISDGYVLATGRHRVQSDRWLALARNRTGIDFDLPTEAQWEFACRGGTTENTYVGVLTSANYATLLDGVCWHDGNTGKNPLNQDVDWHPVGLNRPNAYGLYDMLGNGWEQCLDLYADDYGACGRFDPEGPASGSNEQTLRGAPCRGANAVGVGYRHHCANRASGKGQNTYSTRLVCPLQLTYPADEK